MTIAWSAQAEAHHLATDEIERAFRASVKARPDVPHRQRVADLRKRLIAAGWVPIRPSAPGERIPWPKRQLHRTYDVHVAEYSPGIVKFSTSVSGQWLADTARTLARRHCCPSCHQLLPHPEEAQ